MDVDVDVDVSRWILEFLLRKSENDGVVKRALEAIPFPNEDSRLKKTVLLRDIDCELSDASVSEKILENLEILEELDHRQGFETLDSMKDAYCAVALECTVKYLVVDTTGKYLEAVKRIWRGRISQMEKSGKCHLITDELKQRREEVEAAIWDASLSKKLSAMNTRNDAVRLVDVYLGEAWALMGPAFLELAARLTDKHKEDVGSDVDGAGDAVDGGEAVENQNVGDGHEIDAQPTYGAEVPELAVVSSPNPCRVSDLNGLLELNVQLTNKVDGNGSGNDKLRDRAAEEAVASTNACGELLVIDKHVAKEIQKESLALGSKHVASHQCHKRHVKVIDTQDLEPDTSCCKSDSLSTGKVNKVRQALKSSCLELQAIVTDPLPEAIRVSETIISDLATKEMNCEPSLQNEGPKETDIPNPFVDKRVEPIQLCGFVDMSAEPIQSCELVNMSAEPLQSYTSVDKSAEPIESFAFVDKRAEPIQSCDANAGNPSCSHHQSNDARPSLMERNNTARTYEWDDSSDGSPEGKVNHASRLHLPSPKRKAVSPLKKYEITKFAKRRKIKRWSLLEEDTLRTGIQKYGKGNWKLILNSYREIFQERTEDLKYLEPALAVMEAGMWA
ncbi:hypothetical protein FNV43_RR05253 [Rhamnella rubrinervis]|uniref:Myb-like domain-containing protein n=1 Tax=Rhamnella rubrinervis TaxID=2594499 RepID=A0A8K0MRE6_9ROSA|nr:hypothetical protein FNV43_RR05253 [Rhamnella rubrinervis]